MKKQHLHFQKAHWEYEPRNRIRLWKVTTQSSISLPGRKSTITSRMRNRGIQRITIQFSLRKHRTLSIWSKKLRGWLALPSAKGGRLKDISHGHLASSSIPQEFFASLLVGSRILGDICQALFRTPKVSAILPRFPWNHFPSSKEAIVSGGPLNERIGSIHTRVLELKRQFFDDLNDCIEPWCNAASFSRYIRGCGRNNKERSHRHKNLKSK